MVNGRDLTSGALVVPLMTPAGCAGVLAIELQHGSEQRESVRALATIFAAQLARVVAPRVGRGSQPQAGVISKLEAARRGPGAGGWKNQKLSSLQPPAPIAPNVPTVAQKSIWKLNLMNRAVATVFGVSHVVLVGLYVAFTAVIVSLFVML